MHPHKKNEMAAYPETQTCSRSWLGRTLAGWNKFWFTPTDAVALHLARVLFCTIFAANLIAQWGQHRELFGLSGWFDRQAYIEGVRLDGGHPNLSGWSPVFAATSDTLLVALYIGSLAVVVFFGLGIATRLTGVLTWLAAIAYTTNPAASFGGDSLLLIFAFYLMLGYFGLGMRHLSGLSAYLGNWGLLPRGRGSVAAATVLRLMQVHTAIILMTSGLHKLQIGAWWAGVSLWFPLHPAFTTTMESLQVNSPNLYLSVLSLLAYGIVAWQISFPFIAWRTSCRPVVVFGGLVAALGCPLLYGMPLFGGMILIGCLSFVDGTRIGQLIGKLTGRPAVRLAVEKASDQLIVASKSVA